ncbi:MAG: RimK family protein [Deltaproteobacteria bacterium]|nr:RimK family protein [Deltaproteobacteria bacterium]
MDVLIVVENRKMWSIDIPGAEIVPARDYLTNPRFVALRHARVFNLCRAYGYQSVGYYVSLLATARGHRPMPPVTTMQDLRESGVIRIVSEDIEQRLQRLFAPIKADHFELSIYFGRNIAERYDSLCQTLFEHFPVPLMRAEFVRVDEWRLRAIRLIASKDIPENHRDFVVAQAKRYFSRPRNPTIKRPRYELAILWNPEEIDSPSDERAIEKFTRAAQKVGIGASVVDRTDLARIAQFDALFIRETTSVNHHTFRFARRAEAEGLVVIDDPESIVRCSNKVYQAELFEKHQIPCPQTVIIHKDNADEVGQRLGFPCVLKRPDSSFSSGVVRVDNEEELVTRLDEFFDTSELVVAQAFVPSGFDWRVAVLDGQVLFVCRYFMAPGHWQIQLAEGERKRRYGRVECVPVSETPAKAIEIAVDAANLIGRGLYGVDVKDVNGRFLVMEVNDNPNIESGYEDGLLKDKIYDTLAASFLRRLDRQGRRKEERSP